MITKDSTTVVNFYAMNTDGSPATGKTITATISINGATATAISDTISEVGSGWYKFNHTFSSEGNAFITFSCYGCIIPPWEDDVVEITTTPPPTAAEIAQAVWSDTADYDMTMSGTPKGYYQVYPQIDNPWDIQALSVQGFPVTYGEVIKGTYSLADTIDTRVQATATADALSTVSTNVTSIKSKTDNLPASPAATGDIPPASAIATAVWSDTTIYTGNSKGNRLSGIYNTAQNIPGMVWMVSADYGDGIQNTMGQAIYNLFNDHSTATNITNAQAAIIAAMPSVNGLSTFNPATDKVTLNTTEDDTLTAIKTKVDTLQNTDISTLAKSSELTGLSTFNASVDKVTLNNTEDSTLSAIKTKVDSLNNTDISTLATKTDLSNAQTAIVGAMPSTSGLATSSDVSSAKSDIISAIPPIPNDYAKSSELAGLSTFDSSIDTVQLDSTQLASLATGSEITTAKEDIITAISDIDIDTSELATSTDVAVVADMLKQLDSGVLHWSTTATTLTLFNDDNTVMKTYSLQRDIQGNIVRIDPINV